MDSMICLDGDRQPPGSWTKAKPDEGSMNNMPSVVQSENQQAFLRRIHTDPLGPVYVHDAMTDTTSSRENETRSKIATLVQRYDLPSIGDQLERAWLGKGTERRSLRALAEEFNHRLVEATMRDAGLEVLDGEAANIYRLLTDEDVSRGDRVETRNRLESNGIDVDQLLEDFVSRQAIHTYLTDVRGVSFAGETERPADKRERRLETIQRFRNRLASISEETLQNLATDEEFVVGDTDVLVTVTVNCPECGVQADIGEFIRKGGCECRSSK